MQVKKAAVFASGGGSNFQALLDKKGEGLLSCEFALVVGNNSKAGAFEKAQATGIPTLHIAPSHFTDELEYTRVLVDALTSAEVDFIILAGYMKKIPDAVVALYKNKIINIHPGLLPAFGGPGMYGIHVHEAVLAYGAKISGITVHFVDNEYDHGPVILQKTVDVADDDTPQTLAARVLTLEHRFFWQAVELFTQEQISVVDRRVVARVKKPTV